MEANLQSNFNVGFTNMRSDVLIHLTQWQYWWWFWFSLLWAFYYLMILKMLRFRTLKFRPRIATTFRPHGKWGDLVVCIIPVSWCANIITNSNFILRMIEWQSESGLLTVRIRGKQWYWVYKFELKTFTDVFTVPKNVGHNKWQISTPNDLQVADDYLHILQLRSQNRWVKSYWEELTKEVSKSKNFHLISPQEQLKFSFFRSYGDSEYIDSEIASFRKMYELEKFFLLEDELKSFDLYEGPAKYFYVIGFDTFMQNFIENYKLHNIQIKKTDLRNLFFKSASADVSLFSELRAIFENRDDFILGETPFSSDDLTTIKLWVDKYISEIFVFSKNNEELCIGLNSFKFMEPMDFIKFLRALGKARPTFKASFFEFFSETIHKLISEAHESVPEEIQELEVLSRLSDINNYTFDNYLADMEKGYNLSTFYDFLSSPVSEKNISVENPTEDLEEFDSLDDSNFFKNFDDTSLERKLLVDCSNENLWVRLNNKKSNWDELSDDSLNDSFKEYLSNDDIFLSRQNQIDGKNFFYEINSHREGISLDKSLQTSFYNYSDFNEFDRFSRKSQGSSSPIRLIKYPISNKTNFDFNSDVVELFRFRYNDSESTTKHRLTPNSTFLIIRQKRYKRRKVILPRTIFYKDSEGNPTKRVKSSNYTFLSQNKIILENDFNATKRYKFFKKNKIRDELTNLVLSKRILRTRRTLVLPAHINITAITNSFDVIHSWFIPGLGLKMDAIPGRATHHTFYIDNVGFYYGQCAEICGRYHHHMPIRICALPFEHFLLWWQSFGLPKLLFTKNFRRYSYSYGSRKYAW